MIPYLGADVFYTYTFQKAGGNFERRRNHRRDTIVRAGAEGKAPPRRVPKDIKEQLCKCWNTSGNPPLLSIQLSDGGQFRECLCRKI
jgi:hypothetical protein